MDMRGQMTSSLQIKEVIAELDGDRSAAGELVVYHPVRDSVVSVTTTSLQEIDARTGVLVGEILFDGSLLGDKPNAFECVVACGHKYIVAALSRFLVIWDLREMVLAHIAEVAVAGTMSQKTKHISALTASTDVAGTLFFAHEGSQSIRVVPVEALVQGLSTGMRKLPRKAATRGSAITVLTYHTALAVLGCGASDGSVQLWKCADLSDVSGGAGSGEAGEAELTHELVATLNSKPASVVSILAHSWASDTLHVAISYASKHIEVYRVHDRQLSPSTPIGSVALPHGFTFAKKQSVVFGHVTNTLLVVLDDAAAGTAVSVLHLLRYGSADDPPRFGTPLELHALGTSDPSAFVHVAVCGHQGSALYTSTATARSLAYLGYADDEPIDLVSPTFRQWSTPQPLSFGQYCHPESIPDSFLQLAWSSESSRFDIAKISMKTNERNAAVSFGTVPHTLDNQPTTPARLIASPDLALAGVVLQTPSSVAVFVTSAESSVTYDVTDACFTPQGNLVTLVPSRKSVRWHEDVKSTEPHGASFPLPVAADRIFPTRLPLGNTPDMCKILFVIRDAAQDTLRLSDHSLAFAADSPTIWTSHKNERVVDVQMEPSTAQGQPHNIAVLTTHRLVILDPSLVAVASYTPANPLVMAPVSILWIGSAIAFVTGGGALYYLPTQNGAAASASPTLLCTLAKPGPAVDLSAIQLLACLPDRLVYAVHAASGAVTTMTRPFSVVEVFALSQDDLDLTRQFVHREMDCSPLVSVSHRLIAELSGRDPELCLVALSPPTTGSFRLTSHVATSVVCGLLMGVHQWKEALLHALVDDPGLQEYATDPVGASGAQLPQRLSGISSQLSHLGRIMEKVGQFSSAAQCYDVAGNDRALLELVLKSGETDALDVLVNAFRPTNGPLVAALTGGGASNLPPKLDPFRLLCTEHVSFERRSRLLPSATSVLRQAKLKSPPVPSPPPFQWKYYTWRRLAPEEMAEWIGTSQVHYATEEFKPRKHVAAAAAGKLSVDTQRSSFNDADSGVSTPSTAPSSSVAAIGPFLEEEDGVVAYWRFEEGASTSSVTTGVQFVDTSKRENHITIQNLDLVLSSAPVDRGEENKLQPEHALRFPSPSVGGCGQVVVKKGSSTLDIGVTYDEDPYRRSLTVEMWVKPLETFPGGFSGTLMRREASAQAAALWEFGVDAGALSFALLGKTVKTDKSAFKSTEDTWQHVAAVVDVTSDDKATIRLAVGGVVAVTKEVTLPKVAPTPFGDLSTLVVGPQLSGVEMTEIRIWATPRSEQQLNDMKENYLTMAESKKRIKMKIHNRDCQCDKCLGRRQNTPIAKLAMVQPLSLTPTGSRDRRQRMKTPKSEETRT